MMGGEESTVDGRPEQGVGQVVEPRNINVVEITEQVDERFERSPMLRWEKMSEEEREGGGGGPAPRRIRSAWRGSKLKGLRA